MAYVSLIDGHLDNAEHCVCCGAVIPEGRQVCIICGKKVDTKVKADVVEVVRCKDCKYWEALGGHWDNMHHRKDGRYNALIRFHDSERYCVRPDHYCSYGERKEK